MFRRLVLSAGISGLGDGLTKVAGALLVVSLTRDPLRVAGLATAPLVAVTVLALPAGALVDRIDRRLAMIAACGIRAVGVATLGFWVLADRPPLVMLYGTFLLLGLAGVVYENASCALVPVLAAGELEGANGKLQTAAGLSQSVLAQPLAAVVFAAAAWLPFLLDAAGLVLVAALSATLPSVASRPTGTRGAGTLLGLRWLIGSRELRALAVAVAASNIGLGAVFGVFVLIARDRLGTGPLGYGLLLTAIACGGLAGGLAAGRVVARLGRVRMLRLEMLTEALTYAGLLFTRSAVFAGLLLTVLSFQLAIFATISATIRQTVPPAQMLGRVHGAYRSVSGAGMLLGTLLGGVLSQAFGLTAPFWLGLAGISGALVYAWGRLSPPATQTAAAARPCTSAVRSDP